MTKDFLRALPKTDLHVHLDGSLRLPTLIEIARERGVALPSQTPDGLSELVFKPAYKDLPEYLQGFSYTVAVLQDPESLSRAAYEFALDNAAENVRYVEVRYAPQLHVNDRMDMRAVFRAVAEGMERAKREINTTLAPGEVPFAYGIIACALRFFVPALSPYYRDLLRVLAWSSPKEAFGQASLQLARAAVAARDEDGLPVVGVDLAGAEAGYPPVDHRDAYRYAHAHFMKKTVHAGEAWGPESIFQAITELHADRIGHGYRLFDAASIQDPAIRDRERYVRDLAEYIADRRVTIEVCLTSNRQTDPGLQDIAQHSFREMLARNISSTICTDNRLVSRTTVTDELSLAVERFPLTPAALKDLVIYGFKRSFYPGSYAEKRRYVRQAIDRYEAVCREHGFPV